MSRFRKLSHAIWHGQYHFVWVPKYRYRVLSGPVAQEVEPRLRGYTEQLGGEWGGSRTEHSSRSRTLAGNGYPEGFDSELCGDVERKDGDTRVQKFRHLKHRPYWGDHFWARGYCVDTVGLDAEKIRKYVKYQQDQEKRYE